MKYSLKKLVIGALIFSSSGFCQTRQQLNDSGPVPWRFKEVPGKTWEEQLQPIVDLDKLLPGYLDSVMTILVAGGFARDDVGAWVIARPDSVFWPGNTKWDEVIEPGETPMMGRHRFAPFTITGNDTSTARPAFFRYKQISIDKTTREITVARPILRNPLEGTLEQVLSPAAYLAPGIRIARFKANEKARKRRNR